MVWSAILTDVVGQMEWWRERGVMVAFALRWAPFGGGSSEDVWLAFGISEHVYFARLQVVLRGGPPVGVDDVTWDRLRGVCTRRLAADAGPSSPSAEGRA